MAVRLLGCVEGVVSAYYKIRRETGSRRMGMADDERREELDRLKAQFDEL